MEQIFSLKQQWLKIYNRISKYLEMVMKLMVGLIVYSYLNSQLGYMLLLDRSVIVVGLAVVGVFLPYSFILLVASAMMLAHCYALSLVLAGCVVIVFLVLYIVYFRFTSSMALVVIGTIIAIHFGIPAIIPILCGLLLTPFAIIPMVCGSFAYHLIQVIQSTTETLSGELSITGVMEDGMTFGLALLDSKEVLFYAVVLGITVGVVYLIRKLPVPHAWKIAIGVGYVVYLIMAVFSGGIFGIEVSIVGIIFKNLIVVLVGLVVEIFFMGVDYKKTENVQFQDDDYYYYVKAVPKFKGIYAESEEAEEWIDVEEDTMEEPQPSFSPDEAYEQDRTVVLDTEDIERELRKNAQQSAERLERRNARHSKANYRMLKNIMNEENETE